jgi:anti-sigma regulatory factor (Ser/Thr protein kinase)
MPVERGPRLIELRFPAQSDRLRLLRGTVREAAAMTGCDAELIEQLVLAVNEACMNIIQHGYRNDPTGEIIVEILNNDDRLVFRLRDYAPRVDPAAIRSRPLDEIRPGGLGVHLITEVMDEAVFLDPPDGVGNLFQMTKAIKTK